MTTKNETKHTPGPWTVKRAYDRTLLVTTTGGSVNIAKVIGGTVVGEIAAKFEADARLIAAAPELLEALRDLIKRVEFHAPNMAKAGLLSDARAAIAKAEGKEG